LAGLEKLSNPAALDKPEPVGVLILAEKAAAHLPVCAYIALIIWA
jgi:hypothetical protein